MQRRKTTQQLMLLGLFAVPLVSAVAVSMSQKLLPKLHAATTVAETAKSADSFVDSIGVVTHWSYPNTPYGYNYEGVKQKLLALGIRHVRESLGPHTQELGKLGIKSTIVVGPDMGTPSQIKEAIKAGNTPIAAIDAVEGPNEPDIFWALSKNSYQGQGFPQGVIAFQKDLYTTLKSDPATAGMKVIGSALGKSYGYDTKSPLGNGTLTNYVDWGNFHPYPGGNSFSDPNYSYDTIAAYYWHANFPSSKLDHWPYAFDIYAPPFSPKPMAATETGYSTNTRDLSERAQGKYMPRLFLEYFRKGIVRTYSYEFVDEFSSPGDRESNFGLLRHDLSPKPAYTALKNLISVLKDPGSSFRLGSFNYTLTVNPPRAYDAQYVHHLLLQKRDGSFYLVLWNEISNDDITNSPPREIVPPDMPVTLTLKTPISSATVYSLDDSGNQSSKPMPASSSLKLSVSDKAMIVRLVPTKS